MLAPIQRKLIFTLFGLAFSACSQSDLGPITGTGFVVSSDGSMQTYVLTNNHVAGACQFVRVKLGDNIYSAVLVAADKQNDLALLKFDGTATGILSFRTGSRVRLGEEIIAIGFPLQGIMSSSINLTTGTVSSLAGLGDDTRVVQFTAPIQPGNSGGPLLDHRGNVIGIVTSKLSPLWAARSIGDIPQNVNFAIKDSVMLDFLDSRGVHYLTSESASRLGTSDVADRADKAVASIKCDRSQGRTVTASAPPTVPKERPSSHDHPYRPSRERGNSLSSS